MPAGQTSLQVAIPTVTNNIVESNRVLTRVVSVEHGIRNRHTELGVGHDNLVGAADTHHLGQHVAASPREVRPHSPSPPTNRRSWTHR